MVCKLTTSMVCKVSVGLVSKDTTAAPIPNIYSLREEMYPRMEETGSLRSQVDC